MKQIVALLLMTGIIGIGRVDAVHEGEPGRDKDGMFKEHMEYVKARNKLNLDEEKHRDTLENIIDKLNDQAFMETAIGGAAAKAKSSQAAKFVLAQAEAPALAKLAQMSDKEAQCYLDRYPDLRAAFGTLEAAKKHWEEHGEREKRNKACEGPLTDAEAKCYLDRYEDLA